MERIEVWLFQLDQREKEKVFYGGEQMDKARALFRALLPPGDALYTAAEIVRRYFPGVRKGTHPELYAIYEAHHKALNRLMRDSNYYAHPVNADPETKELPPGKNKGTQQPRRWSRAIWLLLLSDDVYEWLLEMKQTITEMIAAHPEGTRFFCELESFEITFEEPPAAILPELAPAPLPQEAAAQTEEEAPEPRWQFRCNPRVLAGLTMAAALILVILWQNPPEEEPPFVWPNYTSTAPIPAEELANLVEEEYLARRKHGVSWAFDAPLPDERLAQQWKGTPQPETVVMVPPPLFDAAMRHHLPVALGHL